MRYNFHQRFGKERAILDTITVVATPGVDDFALTDLFKVLERNNYRCNLASDIEPDFPGEEIPPVIAPAEAVR